MTNVRPVNPELAVASDSASPPPPTCGAQLRDCPTLPGDSRSLITHRIEPSACLERQRQQYHKCYRCLYRGKPAGHVVETAVVLARAEELGIPTGFIDIPIPAAEAPPVANGPRPKSKSKSRS